MMMQVLAAGGLSILSDSVRAADQDNPRGYFELEAVKRTKQDSSWLVGSEGKVVKMIYALLPDLPTDRPYRVNWVRSALELRQHRLAVQGMQRVGTKRLGVFRREPI